MGNLHASEFAGMVNEGAIQMEQAIGWHLAGNHYPGIHKVFVPVAIEAIDLANEGMWDAELEYPNGLVRTVAFTIENLHLESFLNEEE